ncbi:hypothetical protein SAMN05518668_105397 [Sphingobium sp. YR657]|uniref:hypothetical protein n=1 Tax=Sphingobium TaxID=165695 RepID=UPI00091A84ED|nr:MULTISPECIES: hypothetical protein [Sphingobium]SHM09744.1 hypothetical protein SAMN05518668_105397 [Sphingobium sp. YR657]
MTELKRLNWSEIAPEEAKTVFGIRHYVTRKTALPEELIHAALAWTEEVAKVSATHASDEAYAATAAPLLTRTCSISHS